MSELEILNEGRKALAVVFNDDSKGEVTIKKVGLVDMPKLARVRRDDLQLIAMYIEAEDPEAVANSLSDESKIDVLNEGDELNDPLLNRWLKREEKKLKKLGVDLAELHAAVINKVSQQNSPSATSSTSSSAPDTEA